MKKMILGVLLALLLFRALRRKQGSKSNVGAGTEEVEAWENEGGRVTGVQLSEPR